MVLKIEMEDLFWGFVRNYVSFGLRPYAKRTTRTNEILGFYSILGKMLGCYVEYEKDYFDLQWFWGLDDIYDSEPWLHIEHENSRGRLTELLKKIEDSYSENIVVIGYPKAQEDWDEFLVDVRSLSADMDRTNEILVILNARKFVQEDVPLKGYVFRGGKMKSDLEAVVRSMDDGTYYAEAAE